MIIKKKPSKLILIKELSHPENKLKKSDYFTTDKPGHFSTNGSAHGSYSQRSDPKEVGVDNFAREIAKELDHGRMNRAYEKLILITPPHVNGLLNQHMNDNVRSLISHNIHKELLHLTDLELMEFLREHVKFQE